MATGPGVNQGKTAFAEQYLKDHPEASLDSANEAWGAAGHEGTLSESLWQKRKAKLGLTGKRGSDEKATEDVAAPAAKAEPTSAQKTKGKVTKMGEITPQPTHQEEHEEPSKSFFVEELLGREPDANVKKVNEAWTSAGYEGQISPSVFYKVKRERHGEDETPPILSKSEPDLSHSEPPTPKTEKATKPPKTAASPHGKAEISVPTPAQVERTDSHGSELHGIEGEIDELMFRLKGLGSFADVQDALRTARRLLVRSHPH